MAKPLHVLIVEDSEDDTLLLIRDLRKAGYEPKYKRVDTKTAMISALNKRKWDIVIADYVMPNFSGLEALRMVKEKNVDIPFIVVSGSIGEELAVQAMKLGAQDYIMKGNLTRLIPAIERELQEADVRRKRKEIEIAFMASEKARKLVLDNMLDIIIYRDKDMKTVWASKSYSKRLKLSDEEIMGRLCYKARFDRQKPCEDCMRYKTLKTGITGEQVTESPLDGKIFLNRYRPVFDDAGDVIGVLEVAQDITERKRAEQKIQDSYRKLEMVFGKTVNALASILGKRDPFTQSHQRHVTKLACTIAERMNLSQEKIEGLRLAGLLHDIGKISVPAEILTKPSRLTDAEYRIVKTHAQHAYDILKDIEFPWPIADIVLQHHERLDGSGYPQGLKDSEILLEAKILMVADVVEAMSSHRPYRPAPGVEKALDEIKKNRGILYESRVVDICIQLFKQHNFDFNLKTKGVKT